MKVQHLIAALVFLGLLTAGCSKQGPVVAKVGGEQITQQEFKDRFVQRFRTEDNAQQQPLAEREKMVREIAVELAKYQEAETRGMAERPEIKEQLEQMARRKALDMLYQEKVVDQVITEQAARDFYNMSGQEIKARHILLRVAPVDTLPVDTGKVKMRIDSIHQALKKGLNFKTAATMFSEDATSAADSGDLGWFGWGRMVEEFQRAAWAAKAGDVAGPVKTSYGFHLILVEDKRPVEGRGSYEEMKDQIKNGLREAEATKMMEIARAYVESLRAKNKLQYDDAALKVFRDRLNDPTVTKTANLNPVFTAEQKALAAATYSGGSITLGDMIDKVGANAHRVDWNEPQSTIDLVNAIAEPKFLEGDAEQQGLYRKAQKDPAVKADRKRLLIGQLEKEEVTDKVNPTEEEERRYYENNLISYIQPEMRTIREIFFKDDSVKALRVQQRAAKGENFTSLTLRFNEKESSKPDTGRIGPFEEKRFGLLGKTAFQLAKAGDVSHVIPIGKNYSVIQLLEVIPSRTKTFEEARTDVRRNARQAFTEEARRALEESVLEKYSLTIKEKALADVWPLPAPSAETKTTQVPGENPAN